MMLGLAWQPAQNFGMAVRAGLPLNPLALLMAMAGSSLERSPPWQSAQLRPWAIWTSFLMSVAGPLVPSSMAEWQVMQESCAAPEGTPPLRLQYRRKRMAGALI